MSGNFGERSSTRSRTSIQGDTGSVKSDGTSRRRSSAKPNKEEAARLNRIFESDVGQLERSVCSLDFREKIIATEWIKKLRQSDKTKDEMIARNEITAHLLKCVHNRVFTSDPFNKPPPLYSIAVLRGVSIPKDNTPCLNPSNTEKQRYIPELYQNSIDNGEFLDQLPVPRDGAFFILHLRPNI